MIDLVQCAASHVVSHLDAASLHSFASGIDLGTIARDWNAFHLPWLDLNWLEIDWQTLAQGGKAQQFNQDVLGDMSKGWNNFVKSGQIWALIIGMVLGYLFRSVTAA